MFYSRLMSGSCFYAERARDLVVLVLGSRRPEPGRPDAGCAAAGCAAAGSGVAVIGGGGSGGAGPAIVTRRAAGRPAGRPGEGRLRVVAAPGRHRPPLLCGGGPGAPRAGAGP